MRGALAWREEAAGLPPAKTSNEVSALQSCNRVRSGLTQKVRFDKCEKVIRDKTFSEELSGQLPDLG